MAPDVVLPHNARVIFVVLALGLAVQLGLAVLTGLGSRRRGSGPAVVLLSALFFPVAWAGWYVSDVHPYRHRHAACTKPGSAADHKMKRERPQAYWACPISRVIEAREKRALLRQSARFRLRIPLAGDRLLGLAGGRVDEHNDRPANRAE